MALEIKNTKLKTVTVLNDGIELEETDEEQNREIVYDLLSKTIRFLIFLTIAIMIKVCFVGLYFTPSASMEPTIMTGDYTFGIKTAYGVEKADNISRGDIIVFGAIEDGEKKRLVKRVVGLPGETVTILDGRVYIDSKLLVEDYVPEDWSKWYEKDMDSGYLKIEIPDDQYFVLGDNRMNSYDSRYWGCIKRGTIESVIKYKFRPPFDIEKI